MKNQILELILGIILVAATFATLYVLLLITHE
jgi:hypothetical protein